ncbi:MAG TPA: aconitase X catalytic domain-containing protein [Acidobacteriota bacterium]|nr:aconitase X catalytic domain-containing protein [Acidobacteriota bacterium]
MTLQLTSKDHSLLAGEHGPAGRFAMSILVRMAEAFDAEGMIDISQAHIDSTVYQGEATLEFAERLAEMGARVAVPSTANVSGVDVDNWQDWEVPGEWAEKAYRQMQAYERMGCTPTWTCAPYQTAMRPSRGQQIAWGESNAIAFANSVIGARTERYPDLMDICAAITARVPARGLHLDSNRAGDVLLRLVDVPEALQRDDSFCAVLGYLMGKIAQERVPVIDGFTATPTEDDLKALGAGGASAGAVALFHLVGHTPEAPTLEDAFRGGEPTETHELTVADLRRARAELTTFDGNRVDVVALGSPHFSLEEFCHLAPLLDGRRCHPDVLFLVTTGRMMRALAEQAGLLGPLREFGAKITVDTCILTSPMLPSDVDTLMTNSAKYAYYSPGLLNTQVAFGSLEDCVRSAIAGQIERDESLWQG